MLNLKESFLGIFLYLSHLVAVQIATKLFVAAHSGAARLAALRIIHQLLGPRFQ